MPHFQTVECEAGDLVRVASISLEVAPGLLRVVKKGRDTVYLSDGNGEPRPFHKTRVIEVIRRPLDEMEEEAAASHGVEIVAAPSGPVKRKRGRPPKPRPPEVLFDLATYLASFGDGCEIWTRAGKSTASNILIEPDRKSFWYFRTDPKTNRPKRRFYGSLPRRIGRHFRLLSYDVKIAVLTAKGYTRRGS
jgi:hypothetical protein